MPYKINKVYQGKNRGLYKLSLKENNKALGYHETKEKALKQIQAIEISKRKK
jgi:hypothetical protein